MLFLLESSSNKYGKMMREIICKRYLEGKTLEATAQEVGTLTRERIRQLEEQALLKLRRISKRFALEEYKV